MGKKSAKYPVSVAWLFKCATKKNGNSVIRIKYLHSVLCDMKNSKNLENVKNKGKLPKIFPHTLPDDACVYDHKVTKRTDLKGECLFFDIDDNPLFLELWKHRYDFKKQIPSLAAMFFSMSKGGHIVFRCNWEKNSGYCAYWHSMCDTLVRVTKGILGDECAKLMSNKTVNDHHLDSALVGFSAGYTHEFEYWDDGNVYYVDGIDTEPFKKRDYAYYDKVSSSCSFFTDAAVKRKFSPSSVSVETFVKWCARKRNYRFTFMSVEHVFKKQVTLTDGSIVRYWENDGTCYTLRSYVKTMSDGNLYKLQDGKKKALYIASIFFHSVMNYSFEEGLFCVCYFYLNYTSRFGYDVEREKSEILRIVEYVYGNESNYDISCFLDRRPVVVDWHRFYDESDPYYDTRHNRLTDMERRSLASKVKAALRLEKLKSVWSSDDNIHTLTGKMREWYPDISEATVRRICGSAGVKLGKAKKRVHKKEVVGEKTVKFGYIHAYYKDGRRTRVREDKVDGKNYFRTKKDFQTN